MLMSVFVQNIVDMIVDYALWVAVLKKEFSIEDHGGQIVARIQISEGADEVYFALSWSEGIPFLIT